MIPTTNAHDIDWDSLPTLAEGQCCDLKIATGDVQYWVCRGGSEYFGSDVPMISIEQLNNGKWEFMRDVANDRDFNHVPARDVEIPDYIIPDAS